MWQAKEIIIFFAGAEAFHTLTHIVISFSGILPVKFFFINWDQRLNLFAIISNAVMTALLLFLAWIV